MNALTESIFQIKPARFYQVGHAKTLKAIKTAKTVKTAKTAISA